jgi:putative membrane protein
MKTIKVFTCAMCLSMCLTLAGAHGQGNPKLSDAEVASVAVVANQIDIAYADVAKEKSKNSEILKFAETMTNDHKAVLEQAGALVKKLGVTPQDNEVSKKLLADAEKTKKDLRAKSATDFNRPTSIMRSLITRQ